MKRILGFVAVAGLAFAMGCGSTSNTTAAPGAVSGCSGAEGKCCGTCTADKASPGMVGEKSCSEGKTCTEKSSCTADKAAPMGMVKGDAACTEKKSCTTTCTGTKN